MVCFEVAEAHVRRWPLPPGEKAWNGVFLEVYLDPKSKSSCLPFARKASVSQRFRTGPVEERREMRWRTCNEDGFLLAILTLWTHRARAKKGNQLSLVVDAFRTSINDISGSRVASFRGSLCVGSWGPVTLQVVDGGGKGLEEAEVVLEMRPTSTRPFSLENCRPSSQQEPIEAFFSRDRAWMSEELPDRRSKGSKSSKGSVDGTRRRVSRVLKGAGAGERARQPAGEEGGVKRRVSMLGLRRLSTNTESSVSQSSAAGVRSSDRSSELSHRSSLRRLSSDQSREMQPGEASWRTLLGLVPTRRPREAITKAFQEWLPRDWLSMWKPPWPLELKGGSQKLEVVPLMEAEFRRDCIILFNTLFPRTQGKYFAALRHFALAMDSAPAKLQFRTGVVPGYGYGNRSVSSIMSSDNSTDLEEWPGRKGNRRSSLQSRFSRRGNSGMLGLNGSSSPGHSSAGHRLSLTSAGSFKGEDLAGVSEREAVTNSVDLGLRSTTSKELDGDGRGLHSSISSGVGLRRDLVQEPVPLLVVPRGTTDVLSTSLHGNRSLLQPGAIFIDEYSPRIMLLKRLIICFAACGVYYSEAPNSAQLGDLWPYPIASVLGHGSRVLIRLEDVEPSEFINFLLTGDPHSFDWRESGIPWPLSRRMAATHAVDISETGQLVERKLRVTSAAETVQNISDGIRKKHLGLNVPIGGVGNPSALGSDHIIGFHGEVVCRPPNPPCTMSSPVEPAVRTRRPSGSTGSSSTGSRRSSTLSSKGLGCGDDWRVVSSVQCGHLYLRTDDFGEVSAASGGGLGARASEREEMRRVLREKPTRDMLSLEQAQMRVKVESQTSEAGELFFPSRVASLRARSDRTVCGESAGKLKLIRVRSEPSLERRAAAATSEDVRWVYEAMINRFASQYFLQPPPSVTALRLLLEDYDPLNVQLFGSARFKSVQDLYDELIEMTSYIRWTNGQLERHCEPVILQLCWKGHVLMKTWEHIEGKDCPMQKTSFIATRLLPQETWQTALERIVDSELSLPAVPFQEALESWSAEDGGCYEVVKETTVSPSFPGLRASYKTHMVRWVIKEEGVDLFRSHGLPLAPEGSPAGDPSLLDSDFATWKGIGCRRKLFWKWVPLMKAQKLQRFVNLSEATADARWARYAFQKEGAVQFPPTETALAILLHRCGVDAGAFGREGSATLRDLWLDLTNEESHLQMSAGQPIRVVEVTTLRLRWRPTASADYRIMVQVILTDKLSMSFSRRLPSTRKRKDEAWLDSAVRILVEDLAVSLSAQQVRSLLASKGTECDFREERSESEDYPGVDCLSRTHLVTCTLREDAAASPLAKALGLRAEEAGSQSQALTNATSDEMCSSFTSLGSLARTGLSTSPSSVFKNGCFPPSPSSLTSILDKELPVEWLDSSALEGVTGAELWAPPPGGQERRRVASVLLGLEGTAPNMKSPFGVEHDASGKSAEISALGNRKWRCYRAHGALQIPSDVGGLRMCITRQMFSDFMDTCEHLDLYHPSQDLVTNQNQGLPRWILDQRFAERELFKRLLAGSGREAKEALQWMESYQAAHRTPGQACAALNRAKGPRKSGRKQSRA